ncbi:hypothetical protein KC19_VG010400 [Ceratodon purpureus]|uniref:Uncharacterized protein n=1 Tax=Ceratodon purpureus TaxID=3225 RepID=A0A8T0HKW9_CERPU|nr:hypothetical protein KC19_VG010400 [Ceratodon purpureus]
MSDSIGDSADVTVRLETQASSPDILHCGNGARSNRGQHESTFPTPLPHTASTVYVAASRPVNAVAGSPGSANTVMPDVNLNAPAASESMTPRPNNATRANPVASGGSLAPMRSPANHTKESPTGASLPRPLMSPTAPHGASAHSARTAGMVGSGQAGRPHVLSSSGGTSTYDVRRLNKNT